MFDFYISRAKFLLNQFLQKKSFTTFQELLFCMPQNKDKEMRKFEMHP
jgi:hypothetical protein